MLSDPERREMARDLCRVDGIRAVALGGSRARGTHRPDSDVDLGLYYDGHVDRGALTELAEQWAGRSVSIAAPGGWGPWVDSGAWLTVDGTAVDWILRDLRRVAEQCERARGGEFAFHPQAGHPLGFLDVAYAGEVATCVPLSDVNGLLSALAERVTPYPEPLRTALLNNAWQADFLLDAAEKGARAMDVAYVALCLSTASMLLAHGWHAFARNWVTNEKGMVLGVARLPIDSRGFSGSVASTLQDIGSTPDELRRSIAAMREAARPGGG